MRSALRFALLAEQEPGGTMKRRNFIALFVDKILKGTKPRDIPVERLPSSS